MRKLAILTLLLATCTILQAQAVRIKLTHGYSIPYGYSNPDLVEGAEWNRLKKDIYAVVRWEEMRVIINNGFEDNFILTERMDEEREKDADGDWFNATMYEVMDQDGKTCFLIIRIYEEFTNITFIVQYGNVTYGYSGNIL